MCLRKQKFTESILNKQEFKLNLNMAYDQETNRAHANSGAEEEEEEKFSVDDENDSQTLSIEENNSDNNNNNNNNYNNNSNNVDSFNNDSRLVSHDLVHRAESLVCTDDRKKISFVTSNVGHPMLVVDMYTFHKHSTNPKSGRINWRCSKRRVKDIRCSSSCYTVNGTPYKIQINHFFYQSVSL